MPKQKTHSGSKKRFKVTATGKVVRSHSHIGHLKQNKTAKQNRQLGKATTVDKSDYKRIKHMITNL